MKNTAYVYDVVTVSYMLTILLSTALVSIGYKNTFARELLTDLKIEIDKFIWPKPIIFFEIILNLFVFFIIISLSLFILDLIFFHFTAYFYR